MKIGIKKRVTLAFGMLVFLFFITAVVAYLLTTRIMDDVIVAAQIGGPDQATATQLQLELRRNADAIRAPVPLGPEDASMSAGEWGKAFDASVATFSAAARDENSGLPSDLEQSLASLLRAGTETLELKTRVRNALAELASASGGAIERTNAFLDGERSATGSGARFRRDAARDLTLSLEALRGVMTAYVRADDVPYRETLRRLRAASGTLADRFAPAWIPEAERAWYQTMAAELVTVPDKVAAVVEASGDHRARVRGFNQGLSRLDAVLAKVVSSRGEQARLAADLEVATSTQLLILFLAIMTAVGGILGATTGVLLIRRIVRPMDALTEGATAMARGDLDHRIDVQGDDEFGRLAKTINWMTERRQQSEEALRLAANRDSLTGLPNRVVFLERLAEALSTATRIDRKAALLMLDLDHFKDVNDTLGHPVGDELLKQVAERLLNCVRQSDTVSRLGGDEFAIVQTNMNSDYGVEVLARRIVNDISQPFDIDGERIFSGTSIGITLFPNDGNDGDTLIKNADLALYRAKQEGRNTYTLYDAEMNAKIQDRKALEVDLREAIANDDLFLNFQPKIDVQSGRVIGAEALVRWYHEARGMVSPAAFIPIAEQSGLIIQITNKVMRMVCEQLKEWRESGLPELKISFNLSPADFRRDNLTEVVKSMLAEFDIPHSVIELEITEGMVMSSADRVYEMLDEFRQEGISLAIDDFGTGYSSMAYLMRFPIDSLKIDQAFVRNLSADNESASITTAIINLAHGLHMRAVAEGVETADHYTFLRERGCDEAQGYWISRPLHAAAFRDFIVAHYSDEEEGYEPSEPEQASAD